MDTENVVYAHSGILFRLTKKWNLDTHYNVDEPGNIYTTMDKIILVNHLMHFMCQTLT